MTISSLAQGDLQQRAATAARISVELMRDASRPHPISLLHVVNDGRRGDWELEVSLRPADLPRPTPLLEAP